MKIKVTTERDCCHFVEDLLPYRGASHMPACLKLKFCKHCGQLWYLEAVGDGFGSHESQYTQFVPSCSLDDYSKQLRRIEPNFEIVNSVCLSKDHSFSLMPDEQKKALRAECLDWLHAWRKEAK